MNTAAIKVFLKANRHIILLASGGIALVSSAVSGYLAYKKIQANPEMTKKEKVKVCAVPAALGIGGLALVGAGGVVGACMLAATEEALRLNMSEKDALQRKWFETTDGIETLKCIRHEYETSSRERLDPKFGVPSYLEGWWSDEEIADAQSACEMILHNTGILHMDAVYRALGAENPEGGWHEVHDCFWLKDDAFDLTTYRDDEQCAYIPLANYRYVA